MRSGLISAGGLLALLVIPCLASGQSSAVVASKNDMIKIARIEPPRAPSVGGFDGGPAANPLLPRESPRAHQFPGLAAIVLPNLDERVSNAPGARSKNGADHIWDAQRPAQSLGECGHMIIYPAPRDLDAAMRLKAEDDNQAGIMRAMPPCLQDIQPYVRNMVFQPQAPAGAKPKAPDIP